MISSLKIKHAWTISLIVIFGLLVSPLQSQNYVSTYAGTGGGGFVNGDTSIASFNRPFGICIDTAGNLYIADAYNHCIRKIGTDGQVSTYAGTGTVGYLDGEASEAKFNQPINICLDDEGNMYVSDFINQRIRKISSDMMVTTIAGTGQSGHQNGAVAEAKFNYPRGICIDDTGNLYIGDSWNHRIRKISIDGTVSDWAGGGTIIGVQSVGDYVDASDTAARFYTPCELSIDQFNNIFVADAYNHRIRKIDASRMVTTVAGSGGSGPNAGGFQNGSSDIAQFNVPTACHVTLDGTIFVGDGSNQRVRKIGTDQMVVTFAGSGDEGFENGPDSLATFNFPRGSVMDYNLNRLYVVDYNNHAIRIIHIESGVGTQDIITAENEVHVFPNPSSGQFSVTIRGFDKEYKIQIIDLQGKVVYREDNCIESKKAINLSNVNEGLYYVILSSERQLVAMRKVIITK